MRPTLAVVFTVGVVGAVACSGARESHQAPAVPPIHRTAKADIPSLLSLSIDKLIRRMGPQLPVPAGFSDPVMPSTKRPEQWDSTTLFQWQSLTIVASYNYQTRQVNDLILLGSNEEELMRRAKLQLGAEKYLVVPVFQGYQPTQLLGLRVVAITPTH